MNRISRFALAAALIALPVAAQAQTITGSIGAQADVATVFAFGTVSPLSFGSVIPGASSTGTGNIIINRNVKVMYTLTDGATTGLLTLSGGTATLQPSFTSCGTGSTGTVITTSWTVSGGVCTPPATFAVAPTTGTVQEFVIFNASLTTATTTLPGTYVGTIKLSAAMN